MKRLAIVFALCAVPAAYASDDGLLNAILISNSVNAASQAATIQSSPVTPKQHYGSAYEKYRPRFWQDKNTKTMNMVKLQELARHQGTTIYNAKLDSEVQNNPLYEPKSKTTIHPAIK
jgi:hypothetical protein